MPMVEADAPERLADAFAACQSGTLLITNVETLGAESRERRLAGD